MVPHDGEAGRQIYCSMSDMSTFCQTPLPRHQVDIHDAFSHWSIDNAGPCPPDKEAHVLIAVDHLSANFLYYYIVCRYGVPQSIQSDNGTEFVNEIIERLTTILNIRHRFNTPYYPQITGRMERTIGSLKSMMTKCVHDVEKHEDGYCTRRRGKEKHYKCMTKASIEAA